MGSLAQAVMAFLAGVVFIPSVNYWLTSYRNHCDLKREKLEQIYELSLEVSYISSQFSARFHNAATQLRKDLDKNKMKEIIKETSVNYIPEGPDPFILADKLVALAALYMPDSYPRLNEAVANWRNAYIKLRNEIVLKSCGQKEIHFLPFVFEIAKTDSDLQLIVKEFRWAVLNEHKKYLSLPSFKKLKRLIH